MGCKYSSSWLISTMNLQVGVFRVQGLGFRVSSSSTAVKGLGLKIYGVLPPTHGVEPSTLNSTPELRD